MTSKKELKKERKRLLQANKDLAKENYKLAGDFTEIADAWSTYQSTHPDLTGVVTSLEKLVAVEAKRNQMIQDNNDRAAKNMEEWEKPLKENEVKVDDFLDIQREAVERDYPESEAQFEQNLALMLHRAEDEGGNHCVIMGTESNGDVKAWIRVLFTEPASGVDYTTRVFNYQGKNYLEYDLWNETKLRDIRLSQAEQTIKEFQETVRNRDAQLKRRDETISELQRTQELHESQIKAYVADQLDNQRLITELKRYPERVANVYVPTEQDEQSAAQALAESDDYEATNMRDPRYRAAVEAMDGVRDDANKYRHPKTQTDYAEKEILEATEGKPRIGNGDKTIGQKPSTPEAAPQNAFYPTVAEPSANYNAEGKRMIRDNPQA